MLQAAKVFPVTGQSSQVLVVADVRRLICSEKSQSLVTPAATKVLVAALSRCIHPVVNSTLGVEGEKEL